MNKHSETKRKSEVMVAQTSGGRKLATQPSKQKAELKSERNSKPKSNCWLGTIWWSREITSKFVSG